MFIPKLITLVIFVLVHVAAFSEDSECNDSDYRKHLEGIDCSLKLSEFKEFLDKAENKLQVLHPSKPKQRTRLTELLEEISNHEEIMGECLVKHGEPEKPEPFLRIYTSATIAVMSLRAWIESRPEDVRLEERARSKFQELQQAVGKNEHNHAFNTDAGKACAG